MSASFAERIAAIVRPPSKINCVIVIVADSLVIVAWETGAAVARPKTASAIRTGTGNARGSDVTAARRPSSSCRY